MCQEIIGERALNIVMVEDDRELLELSSEIVQTEDFSVQTFSNAYDALPYIKEHWSHLALVITDVRMPKMSGIELFVKVRELSLDLPVLFCSGSSDVLDNPVIKSDPRVDLLKKPYPPQALIDMVKKVLAK